MRLEVGTPYVPDLIGEKGPRALTLQLAPECVYWGPSVGVVIKLFVGAADVDTASNLNESVSIACIADVNEPAPGLAVRLGADTKWRWMPLSHYVKLPENEVQAVLDEDSPTPLGSVIRIAIISNSGGIVKAVRTVKTGADFVNGVRELIRAQTDSGANEKRGWVEGRILKSDDVQTRAKAIIVTGAPSLDGEG